MPQRIRPARVLGPYPTPDGTFRIIAIREDGERVSRVCETWAEAEETKRLAEIALRDESTRLISECLDEYETFLREHKGNKPNSVKETVRRLRLFLPADILIRSLTPTRAAEAYESFSTRALTIGKGEKAKTRPISVDYQRNALAEGKTFAKWCVSQGWLRANPFDGIEGKGKRRKGKPQLHIDEARAWLDVAMNLAKTEPGAVAALLTLLLGVRAQEITKRAVRDLDDNGRLLRIEDAKTPAGERQLELPPILRTHLKRLAKGKKPGDLLFGHHWRDWPREWVQRICDLAGVPKVSAHSMRGLHSSLAVEAGATSHLVAAALGHEDFATTERHYATPQALGKARQRATLQVLDGGSPGKRSRYVPAGTNPKKPTKKT